MRLAEDDYDVGDGRRRSWSSADAVTFSSPLGTRTFRRLPLGVKVAGQHFNRQSDADFADMLYHDLFKFVDDFCVANENKYEHMRSLVKLFTRLATKGYSVKPSKVVIMPREQYFLGHISTPTGMKPTTHGTDALKNMPVPKFDDDYEERAKSLRRLRAFLGLGSFNRRYVKNFSQVAAPLNRLTEKGTKSEWTKECQDAWDTIINAIVETRGVYHPDYSKPFHLRCDASKDGIGGYLFQKVEVPFIDKKGKEGTKVEEHVIEYFSRTLPKPLRQYDAKRLELLAVLESLEHFKPIFQGRRIKLESDHKNLTFLRNNRNLTDQFGRWCMRLDEFNYELGYTRGDDQPVSDCLSRNPLPQEVDLDEYGEPLSVAFAIVQAMPRPDAEVDNTNSVLSYIDFEVSLVMALAEKLTLRPDAPPQTEEAKDEEEILNETQEEPHVSLDEIRRLQSECPTCKKIIKNLDKKPTKRAHRKRQKDYFLDDQKVLRHREENDDSTVVVPEDLRERIIREHHDSILYGHPGREGTVNNIRQRYYWPYIEHDVAKYIQRCLPCQKAKSRPSPRRGLLQQAERGGDLQRLSMDLFGPLPVAGDPNNQWRYILVMFDTFSHFLTLEIITTKEAQSVMDAFERGILLRGFLPTKIIITDNGKEFQNELFKEFVKLLRQTYKIDGMDATEYLKHVFVARYSPQQNPVERVNTFIKSMLQILVNENDNKPSDWHLFVQYIAFAYNNLRIPGTKISPFMLRYGHQPLVPRDWQVVAERPMANKTYDQHLADFRTHHELYLKQVSDAHRKAQAKQKIQYDARQIDIEYDVGDQVLAWTPNVDNKLVYKWRGPYVIIKKHNPASYEVRDLYNPNQPSRNESIRNLALVHPREPPMQLRPTPKVQGVPIQKGKFVIFRIPSKRGHRWRDQLWCGELFEGYDLDQDYVIIHYYADFGKNDNPRDVDLTSPLSSRVLLPMYEDPQGRVFTNPEKRDHNSQPVVTNFRSHEIEILYGNFDLINNKVPIKLATKAYLMKKARDQQHHASSSP